MTDNDALNVMRPTRRNLLVASGAGVSLLATSSTGSGSVLPPAAPPPAQVPSAIGISPRAFGAIGDGQARMLADRFATLEQARSVYPFAERLDQSVDWAGIQAALNFAEPVGGLVVVPTGRFIISDSLRIPSGITLQGESRNGSVIDNQNHPLNAPQLTNKDPAAFLYVTIRDITLNGGTHALRVQALREVAGLVIEGVTTNLQAVANFEFSSIQTTVIRDCHLMDGEFGLNVLGFPCNSVHLINTRIGQHRDASIRLRAVDGFVMMGGSIEAGRTPGKATIDIETGGAYAQAIHFEHVYFENTHDVLLRSRGTNSVSFGGCKFTGTGGNGATPGPYRFDCAGDLISFSDNFFHVPMPGPSNMLVVGNNHGLVASGNVWRQRDPSRATLTSRRFSFAQAKEGLFAVSLADGPGRIWGEIELFIEVEGRPLRKQRIPIDFVMGTGSGPRKLSGFAGSGGQLVVGFMEDEAHVSLSEMADEDLGNANVWFDLDLRQAGSAPVNVTIR